MLEARKRWARRALQKLKGYLEELEASPDVLPGSLLGKAVAYAVNQWEALVRYPEDLDLKPDNNAAESALRAVAVGRKNYLFFGSAKGGDTAAVLYSMMASCKALYPSRSGDFTCTTVLGSTRTTVAAKALPSSSNHCVMPSFSPSNPSAIVNPFSGLPSPA